MWRDKQTQTRTRHRVAACSVTFIITGAPMLILLELFAQSLLGPRCWGFIAEGMPSLRASSVGSLRLPRPPRLSSSNQRRAGERHTQKAMSDEHARNDSGCGEGGDGRCKQCVDACARTNERFGARILSSQRLVHDALRHRLAFAFELDHGGDG